MILRKSSEIDPIPTSLLKELIDEVAPVLTKLFNISLIVAAAFKQAIIKPLLKNVTNIIQTFTTSI